MLTRKNTTEEQEVEDNDDDDRAFDAEEQKMADDALFGTYTDADAA